MTQTKPIVRRHRNLTTEYGSHYKNDVPRVRGPFMQPNDLIRTNSGTREFETTNKMFHQPFVGTKPSSSKKRTTETDLKLTDKQAAMQGETEHKSFYQPLNGKPASQEAHFFAKTQPFDVDTTRKTSGTTVNAAEYVKHTIAKSKKVDPLKTNISLPTDTFGGETTLRGDFPNFNKPRSPIRRQPNCLSTSKSKFEGDTTNHTEFVPAKDILATKAVSMKKKDDYIPPEKPFDSISRTISDYPKPPEEDFRRDLARWNNHLFETDLKIDDKTMSKSQFVPHPIPPKLAKRKEARTDTVPVGGSLSNSKPVLHDLGKFDGEPRAAPSGRPKTSIRLGSATFRGTTHNQEVHQSFTITKEKENTEKRDPRKATLAIKRGDQLDYMSESKGTYTVLQEKPSNTGRVPDSELFPRRPLPSDTTYKMAYPFKTIHPEDRKPVGKDVKSSTGAELALNPPDNDY